MIPNLRTASLVRPFAVALCAPYVTLSARMSEYQYYEFAAIDGPISDVGLGYARTCSSRANVSRVRWQNTYSFGDFHGSVDTLLKYYDATTPIDRLC